MTEPTNELGRAHCYVCDKVQRLCLCGRIQHVPNRTKITILQHPRECRHPLGTARIARLSLLHCDVLVAHGEVLDLRSRITKKTALLFPEPGAPTLSTMPMEERPDHLIVVDGTWPQARKLVKVNPDFQGVPRVVLKPTAPSNYRIRKEPNAASVSTIEAIVHALRVLEPETPNIEGLLETFDSMIDDQLREGLHSTRSPRARNRPRPDFRLPAALLGPWEQLVFLHAEQHQPCGHKERFPLRVCAAGGDGSPPRDWLVNTSCQPNESRIHNMGLGDVDLSAGAPEESIARELRAMLRPGQTLVAWPHTVPALLNRFQIEQPFICLKHVAANWQRLKRRSGAGTIDQLLKSGAIPVLAPALPGRAGAQLASIIGILRYLRASSVS